MGNVTSIDLLETRTVEGGGGAACASDGDEFDGAGAGTPGHADKHV
jgi:hypothetical protein